MKRFWTWFTTPDPTPGFTVAKIVRLFLKSTIFAFVAVTLQLILVSLGLSFFATTWGALLIVVLVYIPFARILSADFAPPPRPVGRAVAGKGKVRKDRRKFAGVKKSGPRF